MKQPTLKKVSRVLASFTAAALITAAFSGCSSGSSSSSSPTSAASSSQSGASSESAASEAAGDSTQQGTGAASQSAENAASQAGASQDGSSAQSNAAASTPVDPSNLSDGEYSIPITFTGGTGKVSLTSPTKLTVDGDKITLTFHWSSKNYDYMRIGEEKYLPVSASGEPSTFEIPLSELANEFTVYADTVAMSAPHEIEYTITLELNSITAGAPDMDATASGDGASSTGSSASEAGSGSSMSDDFTFTPLGHEIPSWFTATDSMKLSYAQEYSVDYDAEGRAYICIGTDQRFLLLPEGTQAPSGVSSDVIVIQQPLKSIYAASSSTLDLFDKCGAVDLVRLVSSDYNSWTIQSVRDGMDSGAITYVGKYSEPDFEMIAASGVDFILENNMIYHSPSTLEKLRELGFDVMIDRMSYESHPLGRAEWIRLIGLLTGHTEEADSQFAALTTKFEASIAPEKSDKTVAFFYISSTGAAVVRLPGDYISQMIRLAGGNYVFDYLAGESTTKATMTLEMEAFYTAARDADILIYNNSIDSDLTDIDGLLAKSPLLANFKAIKDGNVWCTGENVYQQVTSVADLIEDFHAVIFDETDGKDQLNCLTKLK